MKGREARWHKRFARRYSVRFGMGAANLVGFTIDISAGGLAISGKKAFKPPAQVVLCLHTPKDGDIHLDAVVRWCRQATIAGAQTVGFEMGVQITKRSEIYIQFLQKIVREADTHEYDDPNFHRELSVTYENQATLLKEYEENMSRGGIFIPTGSPPALRSTTQFTINLLEVMDVLHAEGSVIYVLDEKHAAQQSMPPGVGLQITRFFYDDDKKLQAFLEGARAAAARRQQAKGS